MKKHDQLNEYFSRNYGSSTLYNWTDYLRTVHHWTIHHCGRFIIGRFITGWFIIIFTNNKLLYSSISTF